MDELRKLILYQSFLTIAEQSVGYFILWRLLGIVGLVVAYALITLGGYLIPFIQLLVSPIINKSKNKLKILKTFYLLDIVIIASLYPLFVYLSGIKPLFIAMFIAESVFAFFVKSVEYLSLDVLVKSLVRKYSEEVYLIDKYNLVALGIGQVLGAAIVSLSILMNLMIIVAIAVAGLLFLLSVGNVEVKAPENPSYLGSFKKAFSIIKNGEILRKIMIFEVAYSLPNSLFSLFLVYLVYYVLHLPPVLIGLWSIVSISGNLLGVRFGYKLKPNKTVLLLMFLLSDLSFLIFLFITNDLLIAIAYLSTFLASTVGGFIRYYYSFIDYSSLIPTEEYATVTSMMSSIKTFASAIITVISALVVGVISYQAAVLLAVALFAILDFNYVPFFLKLMQLRDKTESSKE